MFVFGFLSSRSGVSQMNDDTTTATMRTMRNLLLCPLCTIRLCIKILTTESMQDAGKSSCTLMSSIVEQCQFHMRSRMSGRVVGLSHIKESPIWKLFHENGYPMPVHFRQPFQTHASVEIYHLNIFDRATRHNLFSQSLSQR